MAHSNNLISTIKLPNGVSYELHDAQAIHSVEELGLSAALVFKGTKAVISDLPTADNKIGDVWYVTEDDCEYVWTEASQWEAFGNIHDAASSTHTHNVTVVGNNESSTVTGTVTVPTVSASAKYLNATASAPELTKNTDTVLGTNTKFTVSGGAASVDKTYLSATASGASVAANGTAKPITALGTATTAAAITELNTATIKNPTVTAVSIPNVTGNSDVTATKISSYGTAASWSASVSNGVLSFSWTPNTIAAGSDVTASKTTLGTALSASSVSTSNVTVATGSKNTANAITGFGTHTTATCLTGVKMSAQPTITIATGDTGDVQVATDASNSAITVTASGDNVTALTSVTAAAPAITLNNSGTSGIKFTETVTVGSTSASLTNGTAAAQKWTQASGVTGQPIDN